MTGFPDPMAEVAFIGPLGDSVHVLEPQVETCREALLLELLVFFGNAVGRTAHMQVARTRHFTNEYVVLVGQSSRARKGTVRDVAADVVKFAEPTWAERGVIGGATSGEGIIAAVRDPISKRRRATKQERKDIALTHEIDGEGYLTEEVDPGVGDKRVVFDEAELSSVFKVATREGNTLSERFRRFYDTGSDQIANKNSPMRATDAHVSINGHITVEELRARLTELDAANGWGNRFLFCATRRVRRLPRHVISDYELATVARPLGDAISWARECEPEMTWAEEAWQRWEVFYNAVSDDVEGIAGALIARAESHVLRLAIMYAVADRSMAIRTDHLEAALSIWDYCSRSVEWVWAGMHGNADADRIFGALLAAGVAGLSRTGIRDLFSRNRSAVQIDLALDLLERRGVAIRRMVATGGRSAEWWWHVRYATPTTQDDGTTKGADFGRSDVFGRGGWHS